MRATQINATPLNSYDNWSELVEHLHLHDVDVKHFHGNLEAFDVSILVEYKTKQTV